MNNVLHVLKLSTDEQERFFRNQQSESLEQFRMHHGVADAGLVFQAHEDKTFGRAGTLTTNHISSNAHIRAVSFLTEIARTMNALQARANQSHGMPPYGKMRA